MLAAFEKIEANVNHSFFVNHLKVHQFPSPLHFHPEIEILLVVQGTGTKFVGDSVEPYSPGDLVMIGENIPHVWYSNAPLGKNYEDNISEAIYIQFNKDVFGNEFWRLPESNAILKLIEQSRRGLKITGKTRDEVTSLMLKSIKNSDFMRIIMLMTILEKIASKQEYQFISSPVFNTEINKNDSDRLNKVYEYVLNNFQQEITLKEIASIASYTPPAFCRYFKTRTHKTFIRFLNEIRIGQACRLLAEDQYSIADVCYMSGFNNVSYFIKQFKKTTELTPMDYRKRYI